MGDLKALALATVVLTGSGCAARLPYETRLPRSNDGALQAPALTGEFETSDLRTVDLSDYADKPTVLVFSQDTCTDCGTEADSLRSSLAHPESAPARIHLETILIGAIPDDAADWKSGHRVPWEVGIDPDSTLFKQYCPMLTVPCVIVAMPGQGIVLRKNGLVSRDEIAAFTGEWEVP